MNQDEYPGLSEWWVQLRIGEDGEEVLARVYGNTPEQAHSRATALTAQPGQALTQQTLDDVMAGIPARDAEIEALRREMETLQAQHTATLSSIEAFVACDASAISYLSLGEYRTALLKMLRQAPAITSEKE